MTKYKSKKYRGIGNIRIAIMQKYIILSILNSIIIILGQTLWKIGLSRMNNFSLKILIEPLVILGMLVYGVSTLLWFYILSKIPFSIAYPLNSIVYVLSMLVGYFLFSETLSLQKILGTLLLLTGVTFIARG